MSLRVPEAARREIKFVALLHERERIRHWLRFHRAGFHVAYPDRWIHNVYFDTLDMAAFGENLAGISSRTKVRYRWYGEGQITPAAGTLEVKQKRNSFGWKLRFPVPDPPYRDGDSWREVRRRLGTTVNPEGRLWIESNPQPVLINRYYRNYFVSADERIRMTIDTRQAAWDQRKSMRPNFAHPTPFPPILTVELKFDRQDRDLAARLVQGLPIRMGRYSKYMTGIAVLGG
jgi:hypothetical protein